MRDFFQCPPAVAQEIVDLFFTYHHGQPFSLLHEPSFRQRLGAGVVPQYMILTLQATSIHHCHDPFVEGRQHEISKTYAARSWEMLKQHLLSLEEEIDIHVLQALFLHCMLDLEGNKSSTSTLD